MARKRSGRPGSNRKKSIPRSFIEEKVNFARKEMEGAVNNQKQNCSTKTGSILQDVLGSVNRDLNSILDSVGPEGIKFQDEQEDLCEMANAAATNAKDIISRFVKDNKDREDKPVHFAIRRKIRDILGEVIEEVNRTFKLPQKPKPNEGEKSSIEFLKYIAEQVFTVFAQEGLNSMIQQLNRKSTSRNSNYFIYVKVFYQFLYELKVAVGTAIFQVKENIPPKVNTQKWEPHNFITSIEQALRASEQSGRLGLHESLSDKQDVVQLHRQLAATFKKAISGLGPIHKRNKFNKVEAQGEDAVALDLLQNLYLEEMTQLYCILRDQNIQKYDGYTSVLRSAYLSRRALDALDKEFDEFRNPETELITIPDDDTIELMCDILNEQVECNFFLPEDIIAIINERNGVIQEELNRSTEAQKELIQQLFRNKIYKYIESLVLRFARITKSKISNSKNVTGGKFIPISKAEFEAVKDLFEGFKRELLGQIEQLVDNHFVNVEDTCWQTKDTDVLEAMLAAPLIKKLEDFCSKLEQLGIEHDPKFLESNIAGIEINVQEIVTDVNTEVEPDTKREEPNIEDLVIKTMLFGQSPKDKQNETYFIGLEFDDSEKTEINNFLDLEVEPEILKVEEIDAILTSLENSGVIRMLVQKINDMRYCGLQIRDASQIRDIAFEYLSNKKRELREVKKGVIELPKELQEDLEEALKWVEAMEWPFGDEPAKFGLEDVAVALPPESAAKKSSYPKVAWAHYMHLRNRANMPVHIIEQHVRAILAIQSILKSDKVSFSVKLYEIGDRDSTSYWLDTTILPYKEEDQRTSPKIDRLDAHISVLNKKKDELEERIQELEPLNARIAKLKQDIFDLTNEMVGCDKAADAIQESVQQIRDEMQEMLAANEPTKDILAKGKEAEVKEREKDPIERNKDTINTRINEKEKRIAELKNDLAELPKLREELEEIEQRLKAIEGVLDQAFDLAKI